MSNKRSSQNKPLYVHKISGGFNPRSRRWHDVNGRITTKEKALASSAKPEDFGGFTKRVAFPTPITDSFGVIEAVIGGDDSITEDTPFASIANIFRAVLKPPVYREKRPVQWMPSQIRTRMLLSEHFFNTEGDASQVCSVPVELVADDIIVECPSTELREDIEALIFNTQMKDVVAELWQSLRVFGNAYPLEVWDKTRLEGIIPLPPLHIHRGDNYGYTLSSEMVGLGKWTQDVIESRFPQTLFRNQSRHWNDSMPNTGGMGLDMPQDIMRSIHDKGFSWYLYTMPMLSLGFRDLTSRIVHEDAVRAVTEGYKYQLWTFLLGDADHPPLPSEVSALQSVLGGAVIERSGYLVWRNPLKVEVHVPQGLDTLIGKDYLGYLTRQFFRKMGITPRVMSGEAPGTLGSETSGGGGGDVASIDVQLYMERVRFQEKRRIMAWLMYLIEKWVRGTSKTGIKALPKTSVRFSLTDLEMSAKVKDIFGPMYRDGASSVRTYLRAGGLQYENELANKREEQDARTEGLFNPPATFAQMVVGPQGQPQATKTVEQTEPQGSPDKAQEERNASVGLVKG